MNFSQMHERLRQEMLRRINRGTLNVSLLARQTGLAQSHVSHFLRSQRQFSLEAMDRVLDAQHLAAGDLLPSRSQGTALAVDGETSAIPIVPHASALLDPILRINDGQEMLRVPGRVLEALPRRTTGRRRTWQRFAAVRIPAADAAPMEPLVLPNAIVLVDRHYNSLLPVRPEMRNLYAVRQGGQLAVRYVDLNSGRLVLRPLAIAHPVELLELGVGESPSDHLAGRIAMIVNET